MHRDVAAQYLDVSRREALTLAGCPGSPSLGGRLFTGPAAVVDGRRRGVGRDDEPGFDDSPVDVKSAAAGGMTSPASTTAWST